MQKLLEYIYVKRELHHAIFEDVCNQYNLTLTEAMILLVLHQGEIDTAKEIACKFKIAKSHLSTSIRHLEDKGYIYKEYVGNDHRTIHIHLCDSSHEVLKEIDVKYQMFLDVLLKDFDDLEKELLMKCLDKMIMNANAFLNE